MPPTPIHTTRVSPGSLEPPDRHTMQSSLGLLRDWREGSAATAIVMAALLPFAVAWHVSYLVAILASLIVANDFSAPTAAESLPTGCGEPPLPPNHHADLTAAQCSPTASLPRARHCTSSPPRSSAAPIPTRPASR